ncbi:MAG: hypothetical protein DRQ59_02275 [Gammaproteobacteria bacterium]|nr:MAG: hypothetical protein DRQ59_02275 [Gammaproteobacteria bacterium]
MKFSQVACGITSYRFSNRRFGGRAAYRNLRIDTTDAYPMRPKYESVAPGAIEGSTELYVAFRFQAFLEFDRDIF